MYNIVKINVPDSKKLYIGSDWHVFHDPKSWDSPIWEMRGYNSAQHAAEETLRVINERVGADDIIYFLGDGFLNAEDKQVLEWLSAVKCQNIRYLWGNHESNMYRLYKQEIERQYGLKDVEIYPIRMGNVVFIGNHVEIRVGKKHVVLNHFAMRIHNKSHHGSICLSGHSHLTDKERHPDYPLGLSMDCGWDWKKNLWSWDEIVEVMSTKERVLLDHDDETVN